MPNWNSINGIWEPAKERVFDQRKDELYEGKDRAAKEVLKEQGLDTLGMDVTKDPENVMRARQMGMTTEEFLRMNDVPKEVKEEEVKKKRSRVVNHKRGPRKKGVKPQGGGVTMGGGFGDIPA
jgi:hypothetical protein